MKYSTIAAVIACCALPVSSYATDVSVGLGYVYQDTAYADYNNQHAWAPLINVEDKDFYVRVNQAGYYLMNDNKSQLSVVVLTNTDRWMGNRTQDYKNLDNRDASVLGGLQYRLETADGIFNSLIASDMSGNSNGYYGDFSYAHPMKITNQLSVSPTVGVQWLNDDYADYYYGVDENDVADANGPLTAKSVGTSVRPYLTLKAEYEIDSKWNMTLAHNIQKLSGSLGDSSLVSKSTNSVTTLGLNYKF
jgi:outer membrane protein